MRCRFDRRVGYYLLTIAVIVLLAAVIPVWLSICIIVCALAAALVILTR